MQYMTLEIKFTNLISIHWVIFIKSDWKTTVNNVRKVLKV